MLKVRVWVFRNQAHLFGWMMNVGPLSSTGPIIEYTMDHDNDVERRRLGESCKDAFEAGQVVVTNPV